MQIGFISLGCPKNQVDTEIMMGTVSQEYTVTTDLKKADIVVINTCGFITEAKEEAINTILDTADQLSEDQFLLVTGCLAQRYADDLLREMPEIDGLMGVGDPAKIMELIREVQAGNRPRLVNRQPEAFQEEGPRVISSPDGWAYLKIAEGCHNRCSYCAIPGIRGNLRCRPFNSIIEEARSLIEKGCRELVLIAQDTTAYQSSGQNLADLLAALNLIDGLEWIRVLYAHPRSLSDDTIEAMIRLNKVVPYLDLPMQHAHTRVLQRMNRHYTGDQLLAVIQRLRRNLPGLTLRTTVMLGFPGESEEEFNTLKDFIKEVKFNWLGAFAYSQEEGTPSAELDDDVPFEVKKQRVREIEIIQQGITGDWLKGFIGTSQQVLVEAPWRRGMKGRTAFQAPEIDGKVLITNPPTAHYGRIVQVRVKKLRGLDLIGEIES